MTLLIDGLLVLFGILLGALPFVLLGILVSAILHVFIKDTWILRLIPRNPLGAICVLIGFGFFFPVCECGNVPVARRLIRKGVPPYAVIGFLLAAPVCNPIVILTTLVAFRIDPMIVVWRVVLSFVIAVSIARLFYREKNQESLLVPELASENCHHIHGPQSRVVHFFQTVGEELQELLTILFWGSFIASFSQLLIPRSLVLTIGQGPLLSIIAMVGLGFVLSICSNVDAFLALSYSSTFSAGSLVAFMVFGPMVDIKSVVMLSRVFTGKTIFWMTTIALLSTVASCLALNMFFF